MLLDSSLLIISIVIPTVIGVTGFLLRAGIMSIMNRLAGLEAREHDKLTRSEFEASIKDKLDPLKEGVQEMKDKVDKVYDILLKQ